MIINEKRAQVAGSPRALSAPFVRGSNPRSYVRQLGKRVFKPSSLRTFLSRSQPKCNHRVMCFMAVSLSAPCAFIQHALHVVCMELHKEQVGFTWLISCDNWFTYCDKTLATVTTDCRHWALHFYSWAAEKGHSALRVTRLPSLLPLKYKLY